MRSLTTPARSLTATVALAVTVACAPPQDLPEQASDAALIALAAAEAKMPIELPPGVEKLTCTVDSPGPGADPEWVGPKGDTLRTAEHMLIIPPGSVKDSVKVLLQDGRKADGRVVVTTSPTLAFPANVRATLSMNFANCKRPNGKPDLNVYRAELNQDTATLVGGTVSKPDTTITVELEHLSTYIIGAM